MIQRIQSVYLLVYAILGGLILTMPVYSLIPGETSVDQSIYHFSMVSVVQTLNGQSNVIQHSWFLVLMVSTQVICAVLTLLAFKDRKRQMRLCRLLMFWPIAIIGMLIKGTLELREMADPGHILRFGFASPSLLILSILAFLAFKGVKKDDALVRSADRLR
ncbi:MAG TPA: DUF4293 domain-containing protein [Bacteroidia bacterium]|jgi:hypothetical protein|nr:DUF4293 domain-containing protein [Bacteroidia bacterium]HQF28621.1 DUF4293 domain-containing protein [Bacteroidia bacterium]HQK97153.1 DUF4293 domain-containing protein [Bacteroidia bacterium]